MYSVFLLLLFWFKRSKSHFGCCCCFAANLEVVGFKYGQYVCANIHIFVNLNSNNKKIWRLDSCSWECLQTCLVTETDFRVLNLMFLLSKSCVGLWVSIIAPQLEKSFLREIYWPLMYFHCGRQAKWWYYSQRNFRTLVIHTGSMSSGSLKKVGSLSLKIGGELSNLCCPLNTPAADWFRAVKIECLTHFHGSQFIWVYRNIRLQIYGWINIGHCKVRI